MIQSWSEFRILSEFKDMSTSSAKTMGTPNSAHTSTSPSADDLEDAIFRHMLAQIDLDQVHTDLIAIAQTGSHMATDATTINRGLE